MTDTQCDSLTCGEVSTGSKDDSGLEISRTR